jgi:4-aminobutyrate aminotransferase-like enzyme
MYFNTFGGSPVAAAVGMAVLDAIEGEQLQANALNVGRYLQERLQALAERHELIGDVRGKGLFYAVELVQDCQRQVAASAEARQVVNRLRDQGILISKIGPHDNVLKIRPPLVFAQAHADLFVDTLDRVLTAL